MRELQHLTWKSLGIMPRRRKQAPPWYCIIKSAPLFTVFALRPTGRSIFAVMLFDVVAFGASVIVVIDPLLGGEIGVIAMEWSYFRHVGNPLLNEWNPECKASFQFCEDFVTGAA